MPGLAGDLLVQRGQARVAARGPAGVLQRGDLGRGGLAGGAEDALDAGAGGAVAGDRVLALEPAGGGVGGGDRVAPDRVGRPVGAAVGVADVEPVVVVLGLARLGGAAGLLGQEPGRDDRRDRDRSARPGARRTAADRRSAGSGRRPGGPRRRCSETSAAAPVCWAWASAAAKLPEPTALPAVAVPVLWVAEVPATEGSKAV